MTTVRRRPKPAAPWPSELVQPRVTTTGVVPGHAAGPAAALWEEALGRRVRLQSPYLSVHEEDSIAGEIDGLLVALSVLTCRTLEILFTELDDRERTLPRP